MIVSMQTKRRTKRYHGFKLISAEELQKTKDWIQSLPRCKLAILAGFMILGLGYLTYLHFRDSAVLSYYKNNPPIEQGR